MNTHGHHECAEQVGEKVLEDALKTLGKSNVRLAGFYLGNWLSDVSQAVDPVAYAGASGKAAFLFEEKVQEITGMIASLPFGEDFARREFDEAANHMRRGLHAVVEALFGKATADRDSELAQAFTSAFFVIGYFKFVHPESPKTMHFESYKEVYEARYTQYYPHEHLDRPEKQYRPAEAPGAPPPADSPTDYATESGKGLRAEPSDGLKPDPDVYEYLRDDIEVAAALLAQIDYEWASKVFTGEEAPDDSSPEFNMYLAKLGHALHAVEDFFAHSNFIEHAAATLGEEHQPRWYQFRQKEILKRRLTKWSKPGDEDADDWELLPDEKLVATGFFDTKDTLVSLVHVAEEAFDQKTTGLADQIADAHGHAEHAPATLGRKHHEFKVLFTETLRFLDAPKREWDNEDNGAAKFLKEKYEGVMDPVSPDPVPADVARDLADSHPLFEGVPDEASEHFINAVQLFGASKELYGYGKTLYGAYETVIKFIANPWVFITDELKKWLGETVAGWLNDLLKHYAKEWLMDNVVGQTRVGCHSLIAKDHGGEWLYDHQKNCAKAVHHYICETLVRHAEPAEIPGARATHDASGTDQCNRIDSYRWIDWLELLEYFLRNPRSRITEVRRETTELPYWTTHTLELQNPVGTGGGSWLTRSDFEQAAERYQATSADRSLTWQRVCDVNLHTYGLGDVDRRKAIEAWKPAGNKSHASYAFVLSIPDQVRSVTEEVVTDEELLWFHEIMKKKTWEVFTGYENWEDERSEAPLEHHTWVYTTEDKVKELIDRGSSLRSDLERAYRPGGWASAPKPEETNNTRYDFYKRCVGAAGGEWDGDELAVNIVGVRGWLDGAKVENRADEYNDTIAVSWLESGSKRCAEFVGTVDPGDKYTKSPFKIEGCAHLVDGQYLYQHGTHKSHEALVQAEPVTVWRDKDKDHEYDEDDEISESGWFGINIHAGGNSKSVGGWSAGCQVIKGGWNGDPWTRFIALCQNHPKSTMRYTLLDGSDAEHHDYPDAPPSGGGSASSVHEVKTLRDVQAALNDLGHRDYDGRALKVDGVDGFRTKSAVKSFQSAQGLAVDGIAGPITKGELEKKLS